MSILTAKAFRQQTMNPAEGLFLFHPRAMERLIEGQLGDRLDGVSVPALPYYLMPRQDFLEGLETENPEALSVIEGLRLPALVILLPSPPDQRLEPEGFTRLRNEYWARAFEAEVARAWQTARETNEDQQRFGARALRELIGEAAFAEVREVLSRDGRTLPVWEDDLICRAFVAAVVRLRYFATGARGFFYPAIRVWPGLDQWLADSGLDLPPPRQPDHLPALLARSRPGGGMLPPPPLLPLALPYADGDPDLTLVRDLVPAPAPVAPLASAAPDRPGLPPTLITAPPAHLPCTPPDALVNLHPLTACCLAAIERGARVRRRAGWAVRIGAGLRTLAVRTLGWLLLPTAPYPPPPPAASARDGGDPAAGPRADPWADPGARPGPLPRLRRRLGMALFSRRIEAAGRAMFRGRCASSLHQLGEARRVLAGLLHVFSPAGPPPDIALVEAALAEREANCEDQLAALLAARWQLSPAEADELRALVARLAATDREGYGDLSARLLLIHLDQVLNETEGDYYELRLTRLLRPLALLRPAERGGLRLRQVLPFQGLLKTLRALEAARLRLEEMRWALPDLQRFGRVIEALNRRVTDRLGARLTPRLAQAMQEADFVPRNHRERVAAHKMKGELLDVIRHRRHLKFTDVRDIVARNILRLPDPTLDEFLYGDRLRRFDRTASRALPGVYRPGEFYIKGLQQLGAPLFGTDTGRSLLRHVLLPFGGAFVVVKTLDMLWTLVPGVTTHLNLTSTLSVLMLGSLINLFVYTDVGRHLAVTVWRTTWQFTRFFLWDGPRGLLRWEPVAALLATGFMRGLGRNVVQPMLIGMLPLAPIIAIAVFVEEVPLRPGLWLLGLAFALGTLARNTPTGRRFLDDLVTNAGRLLRRINQTLIIGLIQQLMFFFKEVTRRFAQVLHRVEEALTPRLSERWYSLLLKGVLAPVWRLFEALIQFYVTVLVEPQVNPVKHFPIVSVGHKIMLPFLPAITTWFMDVTHAVLPAFVALPLVTLTILLLPGLFGFLVWELKENYKLYQANHGVSLFADAGDRALAASTGCQSVEPAIIGSHGENMRALMARGFHSGALPKAFDRLRRVIREQQRDEQPYPKRLRRCQRQLEEVAQAVDVFVERELTEALCERCKDSRCSLVRVRTSAPRLSTNLVEVQVRLQGGGGTCAAPVTAAQVILLDVRVLFLDGQVRVEAGLTGAEGQFDAICWDMIGEDVRLFAGRAGARGMALAPVLMGDST